ncbi:MAG: hypothetical protein AAFP85_00975 [Pseudomonadota bacterium]
MTNDRANEVDNAAFGVIYGTITVLSLLMALHQPIESPLRTAMILFGAVLAVALAKAYAEVCEHMLASGRPATLSDLRSAWQHSRTVLLAANGPALCLVLAALNVLSVDGALLAAQVIAIAAMVYFGARIGWRVRGTRLSVIVGAGLTALIGLIISSMKYLAH